jgi:UDPglucose 6-dehydrogenase
MISKGSISIIGQGFVGGSLTTVFAERGFDVYVYDKSGKVAPGGLQTTPEIYQGKTITNVYDLVIGCEQVKNFSGIYFVCLPTPMNVDGSADLSIVEGVLDELASIPGDRIAVIKSTVPPGSVTSWNKKYSSTGLRAIFNPEFLREATALDDMRNQDRIILGGPRPHINKVKQLFQSAFPNVKIIKTSSSNAEMVKYVTNCFLATKVSFANEIYQICGALDQIGFDIDYDKVIEYATYDKRLGTSHWTVPSFEVDENGKNLFGFSLSCFPKDLNALKKVGKDLNVKTTVLDAVWEKNLEVRPGKDWEKLLGRAISEKKK